MNGALKWAIRDPRTGAGLRSGPDETCPVLSAQRAGPRLAVLFVFRQEFSQPGLSLDELPHPELPAMVSETTKT